MKSFLLFLLAALTSQAQTLIPTMVVGNASYTNALTVFNAPLKLFTVQGYNSATNTQYVQVFKTVTGATNGATPLFSFPVGATNYFSADYSYYGVNLDKCKVCISSNSTTLALTASTVSIQAIFKAPQ
jgi:hypothetical protein